MAANAVSLRVHPLSIGVNWGESAGNWWQFVSIGMLAGVVGGADQERGGGEIGFVPSKSGGLVVIGVYAGGEWRVGDGWWAWPGCPPLMGIPLRPVSSHPRLRPVGHDG
jgi:hypothetical protein